MIIILLLSLIIIIIINVFRAINCFVHSATAEANPWSYGTRGVFLFNGQKSSQYLRRSQEDDLLQLIIVTGSRDLSYILVHSLSNLVPAYQQ